MQGGRYILNNGKLERVEDPTKPHQDGDAPRDERGFRIDRVAPQPEPQPVTTKKKGGGDAA